MSARSGPNSGRGLRIIAGEFGGRRLGSPPRGGGREAVRPSAERTREAIFSMLGPLQGESVLDLYCGSGALGLEAISRGAGELILVDLDLDTAAANVEALDLGERCELLGADALEFLRRERRCFDLVLCDPPYRLADPLAERLDMLLPPRLREGGRLVVESAASHPLRLGSPSLDRLRERRYGVAMVGLYEMRGEPE